MTTQTIVYQRDTGSDPLRLAVGLPPIINGRIAVNPMFKADEYGPGSTFDIVDGVVTKLNPYNSLATLTFVDGVLLLSPGTDSWVVGQIVCSLAEEMTVPTP